MKRLEKLMESLGDIGYEEAFGINTPSPKVTPEVAPQPKMPVIPAMNQMSNFYTVDYSEVIFHLIHFREQLQILHWQTFSFAQHKAFDQTYQAVTGLTDGIVEALMGLYGRFKLSFQRDIPLKDISALQIEGFLDEHECFFSTDIKSIIPPDDRNADIYNMLQEYTSEIKTLKYLLTLK